jgi:predicted Zn-dependent protease
VKQTLLLALVAVQALANGAPADNRRPAPASWGSLLLALLLVVHFPATAQAPAWQSAQVAAALTTAGSVNYSRVEATAVDAAGNVYLAGTFTNTVV